MDCYIYYKVPTEFQDQLLGQVRGMQAALHAQTGVTSGLQRRPEINDGMHTWMEIYRHVPENFIANLALAVQQTRLLPLIHGERHPEFFMEVIPCV
ncbi:DUF4936 family protein [Undibacterium sp. Jales W-56]|uniref:DUF4936 family protein n=1 Tax=Undibacterium sp. Jales W-56 TaxID=2897325 RepID=UPI0021D1DF3E|nr:DUF4936 family protein [Undibacterium sp. Jales W-56]MCU6433388.1 DUF4936 family protein [Undibacterium sp. Jales W-56]